MAGARRRGEGSARRAAGADEAEHTPLAWRVAGAGGRAVQRLRRDAGMEAGRDRRRVPRQEVRRPMSMTARIVSMALLVTVSASLRLVAQQPATTDITAQHLLEGFKDPTRRLMYSGDYSGARHSPLTQITPANVHRLAAQWTFQVENMVTGRGFEGTPIVLDGVMYVTGNNNTAWAVDLRTGRQLWRHRRQLPS